MKAYKTIEQGSRGATYRNSNDTFTVYEISKYPRSSVLAGQQRRVWLDEFTSLEDAQKAYPDAEVSGCTYREPVLHHLPEEGDLESDWFRDDDY
jgi:hypothetical protein